MNTNTNEEMIKNNNTEPNKERNTNRPNEDKNSIKIKINNSEDGEEHVQNKPLKLISYSHSEDSNVIKQYATVSEWGIGYWKKKYIEAQHKVEKDFLRKGFRYADRSGILDSMVKSRRYDYINYALSFKYIAPVALSLPLKGTMYFDNFFLFK